MAVPYTFGNATTSIPLSQLDSNFATAITLGNTSVQLGNTITNLTGVTNIASASSLTVGSNGNTTAIYVDTSQNVGIGTSSPAWKVDVRGANVVSQVKATSGSATLIIDGFDGSSYPGINLSQGGVNYWSIQQRADTNLYLYQQSGSGNVLIPSGNVGIGTTSPQRKVDIEQSGTDYQLRIGDAGGANYYDIGRATANGLLTFYGSQAAASGYVFSTVNGERMRIDTSGNLLVGTTSALGKFTSVASGTSAAAVLQSQNTYTGLSVGNISGTAGYNAGLFYNNGFSSAVGSIYVSGTSTAFNTSSDYRLKTNVTPLTTTQSGPVIDALKPSQFTWKEDNTPDVGFIAHEMQAVIPRAVTGEKDAVDAEGKPVYQQVAVSSPEIIAYLVAEIQSLRARLKAANIA